MKIIAINGSPNKEGNTYFALRTVVDELEKEGINGEIIHIGNKTIKGCSACGKCFEKRDMRCIFDDAVNQYIDKIAEADGILLGSPVHWAGMGGAMKSFLDRLFFVGNANGGIFRHKVGASVAAVRRSGGIQAVDELNKFLEYGEMFMPASNYWNVIHGRNKDEACQDDEGTSG